LGGQSSPFDVFDFVTQFVGDGLQALVNGVEQGLSIVFHKMWLRVLGGDGKFAAVHHIPIGIKDGGAGGMAALINGEK
jgi:hypothetical protein